MWGWRGGQEGKHHGKGSGVQKRLVCETEEGQCGWAGVRDVKTAGKEAGIGSTL